ncbi:MAG: hypothetical protein WC052_01100 [Patescibacteria group bacterium]|jgi:DNA polymerase-3 subunit delta'
MKDSIGQKAWRNYFERAHKQHALTHAYLFIGPAQSGKGMFMTWLAGLLLGSSPLEHPDYVVLSQDEATLVTPIENVRTFMRILELSPIAGEYRVAVIQNLERLSVQGYNALLKTLEEPPRHVILLVAAESLDQLPATVCSRLQICRFRPTPRAELAKALQAAGATPPQADSMAAAAMGRVGAAVGWLHQPSEFARHQAEAALFAKLLRQPIGDRFAYTETIAKEAACTRIELDRLLGHWLIILRDVALTASNQPGLVASPYLKADLEVIARAASMKEWLLTIRSLELARERIRTYANRRLTLNTFFLTIPL